MRAVEIEHVTKTFGAHTAVDDLSLEVPSGSIYGFIGPNGSGKTTTLRMIMRILHPDRGAIRVLGESRLDAATDRVGYLPEERGLYKQLKVREVLRFYAELKGLRHSKPAVEVQPMFNPEVILNLQRKLPGVYGAETLYEYICNLAAESRQREIA